MVLEHIFARAYSLVKVVYLYCFFISLRTSYFSSSGNVDFKENIWYLVCRYLHGDVNLKTPDRRLAAIHLSWAVAITMEWITGEIDHFLLVGADPQLYGIAWFGRFRSSPPTFAGLCEDC